MSSVLSLALQYPQRHEPEDQAVDEAQEACDAYFESDPDGDFVETGRLRDTAYASIFSAAWAWSAATGRRHPDPHWRELTKRLRRLHIEVVQRTAATRLPGAVIAVPVMAQARYLGRPPRRYLLRWGLSRSSLPALIARRAALAVLLTCVLAYALGVTHPYWAVMTTALLISLGGDRLTLTHRRHGRRGGVVLPRQPHASERLVGHRRRADVRVPAAVDGRAQLRARVDVHHADGAARGVGGHGAQADR